MAPKAGVFRFLLLALRVLRDAAANFCFLCLDREERAVARVFVDYRCRLTRLVVLYPDPFMISVIFSAAFLLRFHPDSLALNFRTSLKLTPFLATSSMSIITERNVSCMVEYGERGLPAKSRRHALSARTSQRKCFSPHLRNLFSHRSI